MIAEPFAQMAAKAQVGKPITGLDVAGGLLSAAELLPLKFGFVKKAGPAKTKQAVDNIIAQNPDVELKDINVAVTNNPSFLQNAINNPEADLNLRYAKGPKQKKSVAPTVKDAEVVPGIKIKDFDESLLQTKPLKEVKTKDELPAPPIREEISGDTPIGQPRDIIKDVDEEDIFLAPGKPLQEETAVKPTTVAKDPVVVELKTKIPEFKNLSDAERQVIAQKFVQSMLNPIKRKELVESLSTGELARVERYALKKDWQQKNC